MVSISPGLDATVYDFLLDAERFLQFLQNMCDFATNIGSSKSELDATHDISSFDVCVLVHRHLDSMRGQFVECLRHSNAWAWLSKKYAAPYVWLRRTHAMVAESTRRTTENGAVTVAAGKSKKSLRGAIQQEM